MRVAALYDVHGNLPALEAVLAELATEAVDAVVVGGDALAGPFPVETLRRLQLIDLPLHFVRGNADRELVEGGGRAPAEIASWLAGRVDDPIKDLLAAWPERIALDVDGLGPTLFCHATARNDEEIFTELTPDGIVSEMFAGVDERVAVVGHTHMQVDRRVGDRRIVNAGSVGLPYEGRAGAYWALLGDDVSFRRTEYDVDEFASRARETGFPDADDFLRESLLEPATRRTVAEFFEGVAGRHT